MPSTNDTGASAAPVFPSRHPPWEGRPLSRKPLRADDAQDDDRGGRDHGPGQQRPADDLIADVLAGGSYRKHMADLRLRLARARDRTADRLARLGIVPDRMIEPAGRGGIG
jgi:hypothetical protein